LATSSYQDTFTRLFNKTLPIDPKTKYSEIFNKQLNASLNSENSSYKDVYTLVKNINDKMCELQDDMIPAIYVEHLEEYDDYENDPDYVPSPEGDDSDDDSVRSSELAEAAADLRGLSSPEEGHGKTRSQRPFRWRVPMTPDKIRRSVLPVPHGQRVDDSGSESSVSDVDVHTKPPKVPPLTYPIGQSLGAPLSDRTGVNRSRHLFSNLIGKEGVRGVSSLPAGPARPSSSHSSSQSGSIFDGPRQTLRPSAVGRFNKDANQEVEFGTRKLPRAVNEQQQRSQPAVIPTGPRKPPSVGLSYRPPQAAPASTPAAPASTPALVPVFEPAPPPTPHTSFSRTLGTHRALGGGNNKKRTRKHKKHTSISASRRPTRRRRIPPTEGHKYTRKRPRT
jgi:hypothetical protein